MKRICCAVLVLLGASLAAADLANLRLIGVHCPVGGRAVEEALKALPGVLEVKINLDQALAVVRYDPVKVKPEALVEAVNATGYKAELAKDGEAPSGPVTGDGPVDAFRAVLHRMEEGIHDGAFDAVALNLPEMKTRRDALVKRCQKGGEEMARLGAAVSRDVDALAEAAEGGVEKTIEKAFHALHDDFYKILRKLESAPPEKK